MPTCLLILLLATGDSTAMPATPAPPATVAAPAGATRAAGAMRHALVAAPLDTPVVRPRAVETSEWYGRRLTIHRWAAYATLPVFAFQYAAGDQLWDEGETGERAPHWARSGHRAGAATLAGLFGVNTVTGAWNWWDSRTVAEGRVQRTVHAASMLTATAGFTWAGVTLSERARTDPDARRQHRTVALASMGLTLLSGVAMRLGDR